MLSWGNMNMFDYQHRYTYADINRGTKDAEIRDFSQIRMFNLKSYKTSDTILTLNIKI